MRKALISIGYTYDSVTDGGKLTVGKSAQVIEETVTRVIKEAYETGNCIFFATDGHDEGGDFHPETKLFSPYNIKGTSGRGLYGQLADLYAEIKEDSKVFRLNKRHYSVFSGVDLDTRLRGHHVTTVISAGILADIYILHIAIDVYNLGYGVEIPTEAAASLIEENH